MAGQSQLHSKRAHLGVCVCMRVVCVCVDVCVRRCAVVPSCGLRRALCCVSLFCVGRRCARTCVVLQPPVVFAVSMVYDSVSFHYFPPIHLNPLFGALFFSRLSLFSLIRFQFLFCCFGLRCEVCALSVCLPLFIQQLDCVPLPLLPSPSQAHIISATVRVCLVLVHAPIKLPMIILMNGLIPKNKIRLT